MGTANEEVPRCYLRRSVTLIYVSVGTNKKDFSRLIKVLDLLTEEYSFIFQLGYTLYEPKNHSWFRFKEKEEVEPLINEAEIIICQGGYGIISDAIKLQKKMIITPRELELGEADNDQIELGSYIAGLYPDSVKFIRDFSMLPKAIEELRNIAVFPKYHFESSIPERIYSFVKPK